MALYGRPDDPIMRRQIDGIQKVTSRSVTRRVSDVDRLAFGRGRQATVRLDDASYENGRMYLFTAVLDRFLAEFASVNSFVETVFESPDQGGGWRDGQRGPADARPSELSPRRPGRAQALGLSGVG